MVGVLVIHRIPNTCIGCQFNDMGECHAKSEHRFIRDEDLDSKPSWCPIRKIPDRKSETQFVSYNGGYGRKVITGFQEDTYAKGYNQGVLDTLGLSFFDILHLEED